MNTGDFKPRKTRIERIAKGEKVIVKVMAEDLQDKWYELDEMTGAYQTLCESLTNKSPIKKHKERTLMSYKIDAKRNEMWLAIQERYNLWNRNIGIRDGFALVEMPDPQDHMKDMFKKIFGG